MRWEIVADAGQENFTLTWRETGGPSPQQTDSPGFGSKVLHQLMPTAISGSSETELVPNGLIWRVKGRLASLQSEDD